MHPMLRLIQSTNLSLSSIAEMSIEELKEFTDTAHKVANAAVNHLTKKTGPRENESLYGTFWVNRQPNYLPESRVDIIKVVSENKEKEATLHTTSIRITPSAISHSNTSVSVDLRKVKSAIYNGGQVEEITEADYLQYQAIIAVEATNIAGITASITGITARLKGVGLVL